MIFDVYCIPHDAMLAFRHWCWDDMSWSSFGLRKRKILATQYSAVSSPIVVFSFHYMRFQRMALLLPLWSLLKRRICSLFINDQPVVFRPTMSTKATVAMSSRKYFCYCHFHSILQINLITISMKFVSKIPFDYKQESVQTMVSRRSGDAPLSESIMFLLTHICIIWPQWINIWV